MRLLAKPELLVAVLLAAAGCLQQGLAAPPELPREFRGVWVASVYNIDWPSRAGLSAGAQRSELTRILDTAVASGVNAVILQVRPACDALYDSPYEPWSPYLTGSMGRSPGYDPLKFAVDEAHRRGLELHAWFNPFRAQSNYKNAVSSDHITRKRPQWVRRYASYLWLDPGLPEVREYSRKVILDVVRRYDIDGIHIDDYFYPYPKPGASGFPDSKTFQRYGRGNRDDWRRSNIDTFVKDLYSGIKSTKPWVKFGVSPFGIWRPGVPSGTTAGLDAYGQLYGDSRKWFNSGWLDYFSPQLYWTIGSSGQSLAKLVPWWAAQNRKGRHFWPGLAVERVGKDRKASEIARQVSLLRQLKGPSNGHLLWSNEAFKNNKGGVRSLLADQVYKGPALVPASPWLGSGSPQRPELNASISGGKLVGRIAEVDTSTRFLVLQTRSGRSWSAKILDGRMRNFSVDPAEEVAVTAVSKTGVVSKPSVVRVR